MCRGMSEKGIRRSAPDLQPHRAGGQLSGVGRRYACSMPQGLQMRIGSLPHSRIWRLAKIVWVGLALSILAGTIYKSALPENRDNVVVMTVLMIGLSFPSAYVVAYVLYGLGEFFPDAYFFRSGHSYAVFFFSWLFLFAAGYVQWLVVLPMVIRKLRRHFGRSTASAPTPPRSS